MPPVLGTDQKHWVYCHRTVSEVSGVHLAHISSQVTGDEGWDRFSFVIKLEDFRRNLEERRLVLCVRYSIEGQEWWDSGLGGRNYHFTFRKARPTRRTKPMFHVGNESAESPPRRATALSTPVLGSTRSGQIGRAAGWHMPTKDRNGSPSTGFLGLPRKSTSSLPSPGSSPDVPLFRTTSFEAPPPPDVHQHLKLNAYCAPSPLSPPVQKKAHSPPRSSGQANIEPSTSLGSREGQASPQRPPLSRTSSHERRRTWGGEKVEKHDELPAWRQSTGNSPPSTLKRNFISDMMPSMTYRTASPQRSGHVDRPQAVPSQNSASMDLLTPPSSALSTPPLSSSLIVAPMSPSSGESVSPSETNSPPRDEPEHQLPEVVIDGNDRDQTMENRAQDEGPAIEQGSGIHSDSYKEFVSSVGL